MIADHNPECFVFSFFRMASLNIEDLLIPAPNIPTEKWQLGAMIKPEIKEGGIALIFCSDERGAGGTATPKNFTEVRKQLYQLSRHDWEVPVMQNECFQAFYRK
ncbi:hypothetical protein [Elizabethkingia miricola]|uniref:hypothetical protein n=1 Tax=Elizabethkingia miricola TaxID=172045 RepID=UPI0021CC52F1|nr:hypothetical protein [Elizabethkingia miricola]